LATDIIQEFSYFAKGTRYFVAPEGLSRFYLSGSTDTIGASWMTREERKSEIRWLEQAKIQADKLILWAGSIPPETDLWRIKAHYPELEVFLIAGTKDPYARSDIIKEQEERLEKADLHYRKIRFEGTHELHPPTLMRLAES
jgi:hypothetical protein